MTQPEMPQSENVAADWVVRLQGETAGEGDWLAFDRWLGESNANGPAYDRALALWCELDAAAPALKRRMGGVSLMSWRMSASVGALAASLALGWFLIGAHFTPQSVETFETAIGEHRSVVLADGSHIDLDGATRISVRLENDARRVTMERGEAIYDVAPDASRPFTIAAGDRQIRVVGTEFDVRSRAGAFSVTVRRGVVEVSPSSGQGAIARLTPGDRIDHVAGLPDKRSSGVSADEVFGWRKGQLIYRERPLSEVVADLNSHYAKPVSLSDPKAALQPFSGVLTLDGEDEVVHRLTLLASLWSTSNQTGYVLSAREGAGH